MTGPLELYSTALSLCDVGYSSSPTNNFVTNFNEQTDTQLRTVHRPLNYFILVGESSVSLQVSERVTIHVLAPYIITDRTHCINTLVCKDNGDGESPSP